MRLPFAASVPYLMAFGTLAGGLQLGRAALAAEAKITAGEDGDGWYAGRIAIARAYCGQTLPRVEAEWGDDPQFLGSRARGRRRPALRRDVGARPIGRPRPGAITDRHSS